MLKKLSPNLMVEDVSRTVGFYESVLGFQRVMTLPDEGPLEWALVQNGAVEMMFQSQSSLAAESPVFEDKAVGGTLTLYAEVEDLEKYYADIKDRVKVLKEPNTTFYGMREFTVTDCNGYVLTFAQPI